MGNESSLPTDANGQIILGNDGEELDEQTRQALAAAAAAGTPIQIPGTNTTLTSQQALAAAAAASSSSTPTSSGTNERKAGERGTRPGARLVGAVFGKGSRNNNNNNNSNSNNNNAGNQATPPQPLSPQSQDVDEREKARPAATNQSNLYNHASDQSASGRTDSSSTNSSYYDASMGSPTQTFSQDNKGSGQQDVVASHDYFAQAQQQNLYGAQQAQQQQSTAQNPFLSHSASVAPSGQPPTPEHGGADVIGPTEVGVMYEKPTPPQKKSLFPGRATARGAALISSMRNLNLGGAFKGGGGGGNNTSQQAAKKEVNEWEKQWDADEDDDSDEDEEETTPTKNDKSDTDAPPTASAPLHAQVRPPMDIGHSELPMQHLSSSSSLSQPVTSIASGAAMPPPVSALESPAMTTAQQQKAPFVTPEPGTANAAQQHDLATEWDMAGIQPPTAVVPDEPATVSSAALMASASSLPPYFHNQQQAPQPHPLQLPPQESLLDKPNVQMFLPMLRVLGKGSFGKVVLVQKRGGKERGGLFAMKILRKTHLVKRRQIERTRTERKVLSVVNHPFIMKLHYAFQTPDKLYLVLDYCPGGELFFHLSRFRRFPERVARFYAAELLLAIGHLHKRGIIYRDLKPENVLLDAEGHVKLGDFGLAKAGIKHPCEGATSMCGTPEYMAPEVLAQAGHGFCVDYWGLGMLLYEMMTGLPPWYTTDRAKLFRRLKSAPLDVPSYFSVQAANCVSALLERNPRRRLGVTGIRNSMEHEFFRNISWKSLYARRVEAPVRPCEGWRPPETVKGEEDDDRIVAASAAGPVSLTDIEGINPNDLDAATANFDNTFTRMPVESEELVPEGDAMDESEAAEQLNDDTFLGFSFDSKDRELPGSQSAAAAQNGTPTSTVAPTSPRPRSHGGTTFAAQA